MVSVSEEEIMEIRRQLGVTVNGDGRSPVVAVLRFADLRLPPAVYSYLSSKKIAAPTNIQAQVLPLMFAGRGIGHNAFASVLIEA
jgi:superfamily II DNA/RNA helicase